MGYENATPVQQQVMVPILEGKDIIAAAQTGTGKTAAFLLPLLHRLLTSPHHAGDINAMIIVPTRELAIQIAESIEGLSYFTDVSSIAVYGGGDGNSFVTEKKALTSGVDIVVCTPGRMIAHLNMGYVKLKGLKYLVLDEADRMLDMGFIDDIERIIAKTPATRQTMLFSATLDGMVGNMARRITNDPLVIQIAGSASKHENIQQRVHFVDDLSHKNRLLDHLLRDASIDQAVIFTATKRDADTIADRLNIAGFAAAALHGDMHQGARNRTLDSLRRGQVKVLVATDVAARGIDVPAITHVFNYDLPKFPEDYVHRIGRTGRAGRNGLAISLVNHSESMNV